jgi:hypothetical protein
VFSIPAVLASPVGQNAQQRYALGIEKGNNLVVEHIRSNQGVFPIICLAKRRLGIRVYKGLLVNMPNAFTIPYIIGILGSQIPGAFRFNLSMSLLFLLGLFQGGCLAFRQDELFLRHFGFQRLKPPFEGGQIVAQPNAPYPAGRDQYPSLLQFVAYPQLPLGWLLTRKIHCRLFYFRLYPVLHIRLLLGNILKGRFPAGLIQGLEPVQTVPGAAHYFTGL